MNLLKKTGEWFAGIWKALMEPTQIEQAMMWCQYYEAMDKVKKEEELKKNCTPLKK